MDDFNSRKRRGVKFIYSPIFAIILFIFLLLVMNSAYRLYQKKKNVDLEQERFNKKYELLLKRKEVLISKINKLKTDNGIREEIKKNYDVGEDGETVIHITR